MLGSTIFAAVFLNIIFRLICTQVEIGIWSQVGGHALCGLLAGVIGYFMIKTEKTLEYR